MSLKKNIFEEEVKENLIINSSETLESLTNAVANVPKTIAYTLAVSNMMIFTSMFQKNILLPDEVKKQVKVPISSISFILAPSGTKKDSTNNDFMRLFGNAYDVIEAHRKKIAMENAINKAFPSTLEKDIEKKYIEPFEMFLTTSTPQGFLSHLSNLQQSSVGSGCIILSELGTELASNSYLNTLLQDIGELYDIGNKKPVKIKDSTNQTPSIKGMPINCLMMGSWDNVINIAKIKEKFISEFTSKLARRSFISFLQAEEENLEFKDIDDYYKHRGKIEENIRNNSNILIDNLENVAKYWINNDSSHITISSEIWQCGGKSLYHVYLEYNKYRASKISTDFPLTILTVTHLQWKALKLAGAIAMLNCRDTISLQDFKEAIWYCEYTIKDTMELEKRLNKNVFELLMDKANKSNIKILIRNNEMVKKGYIIAPFSKIKVTEVVTLMNAFEGLKGIFTQSDSGLVYSPPIKEDDEVTYSVSLVKYKYPWEECVDNKVKKDKNKVDAMCQIEKMMAYKNLPKNVSNLLSTDCMFNMYLYKQGINDKNGLYGTSNIIVLDIDITDVSIQECHEKLIEYYHSMARTTDKTNDYKYRILLHTDTQIPILPNIQYKYILECIDKELGVVTDKLPQSQKFFGFKGSEVLKSNATLFPMSEIVKQAMLIKEPTNAIERYTEQEKSNLLDSKLTTFNSFFQQQPNSRNMTLFNAGMYARDLGADKEYITELFTLINSNFTKSYSDKEVNSIIENVTTRELKPKKIKEKNETNTKSTNYY